MAKFVRILFLAACFAAASVGVVSAQLTVINVPSTDTLQEKMFYVEADAIVRPTPFVKGGFQSYGYRTVYGLDRKTEVGVSFFYTRDGVNSPKEMQFSIKRGIYAKEKWGVASTAGVIAFVPLNRSAGSGVPLFTYGNISKTIEKANGLRLTGGVYAILNAKRDFGNRKGFMVAIEQPLIKKFSFVGDWSTGQNRLGYSAAGLNYELTKRQFILASYNVANGNGAGNYIGVFYGLTF